MQCPICQSENFEADQPCPQCGYHGDVNPYDRLVSMLEEAPAPIPNVSRSRLPSFTAEESRKVWRELERIEMLLEKVNQWQEAGYFKKEMEGLDPVGAQRAQAKELRLRLDGTPRPESSQTDRDQLKTLGFLMDHIDLIASRGWFKSKKEIEKAVVPILAMMLDVISGNVPE